MTVMGDATMEELSDAGSIPARSIHDRKNQHGNDSMLIFSCLQTGVLRTSFAFFGNRAKLLEW